MPASKQRETASERASERDRNRDRDQLLEEPFTVASQRFTGHLLRNSRKMEMTGVRSVSVGWMMAAAGIWMLLPLVESASSCPDPANVTIPCPMNEVVRLAHGCSLQIGCRGLRLRITDCACHCEKLHIYMQRNFINGYANAPLKLECYEYG